MKWLPPLLVLVVTALVYGQIAGHALLMWDDDVFLYMNPLLRAPGLQALRAAWTAPYADLYAPVPMTAWIVLTRAFGGPAPTPDYWNSMAAVYHLTSLLMHLLCVGLAYGLLARLRLGPWPAAAGALLFALHPLQVETVAWASELKDLMAAACGLAAIASLVRWRTTERASPWWPVAATAAFALGLLCKPGLVAMPLLAMVADVGLLHTPVKRSLRLALPWLGLALAYAVATHPLQSAAGGVAVPLAQRFFVAGDALAFYLGKLVLPVRLCADYGRTPGVVLGQWWGHLTWLAPAALLAGAIALRRHSRWALPGLLWFALALLPVLGLVPFDFQQYSTVADHYAYLALFGPALALAGLCAHARASGARLALIAVFVLLAAQSSLQTIAWQSDIVFAQHTVAVNPRSFSSRVNLGTVYVAIKQLPQAREQYEAALALRPTDAGVLIKLGLLEKDAGDRAAAKDYLQRALAVAPDEPEAHQELGLLALRDGDFPAAIEHLQAVVRLQPPNALARVRLAQALAAAGRKAEAQEQLDELHRLFPDAPAAGPSRSQ